MTAEGSRHLIPAWTLWKTGRALRLDVRYHPLGRELVLTLDGELRRAQVVRDQDQMLDLALTWRTIAEAKGWQEVVRDGTPEA